MCCKARQQLRLDESDIYSQEAWASPWRRRYHIPAGQAQQIYDRLMWPSKTSRRDQSHPLPCVIINRPPIPGVIMGSSSSCCSFFFSFSVRSRTSFSSDASCKSGEYPHTRVWTECDIRAPLVCAGSGCSRACRSHSGRAATTAQRRRRRAAGRSRGKGAPRSTPCCRCPRSTT